MTKGLSRGESLIRRILRSSTQAVEDVCRDLDFQTNKARWTALDPSASKVAGTALMGYETLLVGPIIPHRNRGELEAARQKYSAAWSGVMDRLGQTMPESDSLAQVLRSLKDVDDELAEYIADSFRERDKDLVSRFKSTLTSIADAVRRDNSKKLKTPMKLVVSRFAGDSWCNIRISQAGNKIKMNQDKFWLSFKGEQQWNIIDALFAAWKSSFGKAEVGDKAQVEKVFSTKFGKYLLKFIHFETRAEAKMPRKKGNYQYTGNAWFERALIYPEKFALKKE